jgi:hypothetical protein
LAARVREQVLQLLLLAALRAEGLSFILLLQMVVAVVAAMHLVFTGPKME